MITQWAIYTSYISNIKTTVVMQKRRSLSGKLPLSMVIRLAPDTLRDDMLDYTAELTVLITDGV